MSETRDTPAIPAGIWAISPEMVEELPAIIGLALAAFGLLWLS